MSAVSSTGRPAYPIPPLVEPSRVEVIQTPVGTARAHRWTAAPGAVARGRLVLGHGAGGRSWSPDLLALTALAGQGWEVVLVEQPWRVAGGKVAAPPARLDQAWVAVLSALSVLPALSAPAESLARDCPPAAAGYDRSRSRLVVGGRSAGARVACRTSAAVAADAVLALAFPLHPPGSPERTRGPELAAVTVPVLVVQGRRDPFGRPEEFTGLIVADTSLTEIDGGHGFGRDLAPMYHAVGDWLE